MPVGDYKITVTQSKFETSEQTVTVDSGSSPILHFQLAIAPLNQTTVVVGQAEAANMDSVTPTTLVDREDIAQTPGADRTNSMAMITDYTPAAYVTHDMLHMRGGHQVDWLIDGVPIPNTNIATNLAPEIDPKDIDYLEVQRGSYDAEYGDRTYGIFNIVPRTGFERDNEAELVTSFGNWYQTNDQLSFGGHTQRFAYYASVNGNRSDYGLQTPDWASFSRCGERLWGIRFLIFNPSSSNQFRLVASLRQDYYQIPMTRTPTQPGTRCIPVTAFRSDFARMLLGDSFHPGGLRLTERLGEKLALGPGMRVLDVASGKGETAIFLAQRFGCKSPESILGRKTSSKRRREPMRPALAILVRFQQGDAEKLGFPDASFDAVLCECAFCTFPDKRLAAAEFARVLRPGGRVGLSDLTRLAQLPEELQGLLAWVACIADARPVEEYVSYLEAAGIGHVLKSRLMTRRLPNWCGTFRRSFSEQN